MKVLMQLGFCCLLASGALAQRHGGGGVGHGGFSSGSRGGFGSGVRSGGFGDRGRFGDRDRDFGFRFGNRGFYGRNYGYGAYWPWLWGYGLGDYGLWDSPDYDYDYNSYAAPAAYGNGSNVTVVYAPPPPPAPPIVIQQAAHPVMHEYRQPEDYGLPSERDNHPVLYLLAFNDHAIRAAMTYWVEGGTLHYLDMDHKERQASLGSVDRYFSSELNRERHVPFNLPSP